MTKTHWECTVCPWRGDEEVEECPVDGAAVTEIYDGEEDEEPDDSLMQR